MLGCAFNVEGHDTHRGYSVIFYALYNILETFDLYLASTVFLGFKGVAVGRNLEPTHPSDLFIDHEAEGEGNIAFEGLVWQINVLDSIISLEQSAERSHDIGSAGVHFKVELFVLLVIRNVSAEIDFPNGFEGKDGLVNNDGRIFVIF